MVKITLDNLIETCPKEDLDSAIQYFEDWIEKDLLLLEMDTKSDYAEYVLNGHKYMKSAIAAMKYIKLAFNMPKDTHVESITCPL